MATEILRQLTGPITNLNTRTVPVCLNDGLQRSSEVIFDTTVNRYTDASWTVQGSAVGILTIVKKGDAIYAVLYGQAFAPGVFADNNQAETHGILTAGRMAILNGDLNSTIITDSASGIRRIERAVQSSQQMRDLTDEPMSAIEQMLDEVLRANIEVQVVHTYGHSRNYGNLIADLLAREATSSGQSVNLTLTLAQLSAWVESQLYNILRGSRDAELRNRIRNW